MKRYKEIEEVIYLGNRIEDVYNNFQLFKNCGFDVCTKFNGKMINSDMTLNEMYKEVTGKTYDEFQEMIEQKNKEVEEQEEKHKAMIPELTKKWIKWGKKNLPHDKRATWKKCVPIRLNDLYQGWELDCFKEIFDAHKEGKTKEEIKDIMNKQGHSGMSHHLECSIISTFLDEDLAKYLSNI